MGYVIKRKYEGVNNFNSILCRGTRKPEAWLSPAITDITPIVFESIDKAGEKIAELRLIDPRKGFNYKICNWDV